MGQAPGSFGSIRVQFFQCVQQPDRHPFPFGRMGLRQIFSRTVCAPLMAVLLKPGEGKAGLRIKLSRQVTEEFIKLDTSING